MSYQYECNYQFEDLLEQKLTVDQRGQGWARCPFCNNYKFAFNTKKEVWCCHGCKRNGHILKLVMMLKCGWFLKGVENV